MKLFSKLAAVAAVTTLAVGGGASVASAYSISGGAYTSATSSTASFTIGGGTYTFGCTSTSMSGSATGADTTSFTQTINGCSFFGFPIFVTQSGLMNLRVIRNTGSTYGGELEIPTGVSTTMSIPIMGCTFVVAGPQTFRAGVGGNILAMTNYTSGVNLNAVVNGIAYTATGCPFGSGTDGTYTSGGSISIPGITVS